MHKGLPIYLRQSSINADFTSLGRDIDAETFRPQFAFLSSAAVLWSRTEWPCVMNYGKNSVLINFVPIGDQSEIYSLFRSMKNSRNSILSVGIADSRSKSLLYGWNSSDIVHHDSESHCSKLMWRFTSNFKSSFLTPLNNEEKSKEKSEY